MFSQVNGIGLFGMNAFMVTAEISTRKGMPSFDIVGLGDTAVLESRLRIRSALENSGVTTSAERITVNLAPANVKKTGSMYDLTILVALLSAKEMVKRDLSKSAFIGEVSLGGSVVPIHGVLTMAIEAKNSGIEELYVPFGNSAEASVVEGITVYGVKSVTELINHLNDHKRIQPQSVFSAVPEDFISSFDFSEVRGQENVKRAMEVAAAGFHNILMIGPPGTGKSMIAKRIPSILPGMTFDESIETTQIHSIAGLLNDKHPLVTVRPFRSVSHTASAVGLIGGSSIPRPGEISLAHNGVLFLDELPEFDRRVLETLRQPLEDGEITISRAVGSVSYPCSIMLVAAMNPCPCGNYGAAGKKCSCSPKQVAAYLGKISQPVLDRIDIQVEVAPVSYSEMSEHKSEDSSAQMLENVLRAQEIQKKRFAGTDIHSNSQITPSLLHEVCAMDADAEEYLRGCFDRTGLSARAYDRILKTARTIADLEASEVIGKRHISRAISYRTLDRKYWGG